MKKFTIISLVVMLSAINLFAQKALDGIKYRRSSLYTILMESDKFPMKDTVIKAYYKAPFPDKYNNHNLEVKSFNPKDYPITNEERTEAGIKKVRTKKDSVGSEKLKDMPLISDKFLKEKKIANELVAKWFNRQEDGSFDMSLISERGFYNATDLEASIANKTARGMASLADAGEELIGNTFVIISRLNFVSNECAALVIRESAYIAADQIPNIIGSMAAKKVADKIYKKTKEGYSVWTTSRLYQLKWNDSIAAVFYNDYWMDKASINLDKKNNFDNSDLFELVFIGEQKATSLVTFSLKGRTEEQIIELSTIRNIDKVYSKLQKEYDVFKTKTPLYSGNPITAKIGMKEGLLGKEKFEVLEQTIDSETGKTTYIRKGIITVDKKMIWDNRYNANEDNTEQKIDVTTFKGAKNYYPGMLIRQIK